jgi:hypothetical protein
MLVKINKLPEKLKDLSHALDELAKKPGFFRAQNVINNVIGFLGINAQDSWKLFSDTQGKIRSNATWFMEAEGFADKRAAYKVSEKNDNNIDLKVYWMKSLSKSIIGWLVALTPNFEDEVFYKNLNVGIDFIIPGKADRILIVLSKDYVVRTLELCGSLSVTQQDILSKWLQDFDFDNKAQVHDVLWQSFDLEPVNKSFYKGISSFFVELKQYLSENHIIFDETHAAYFTNRLIGRIVFCWFLNKKGIINPEMDYFNTANLKSTDYYHQKLETLFFKIFNTPIEERESGLDNKTPFLNGGLFEIKENDKFGNEELAFPKDYFDRFYKFLRHYNFTTDESTSTFQQVAIDPEMLGRIFENLLAEQVEETGEQARKAKGAFYTPREIVDYMCRESLREYLKTKIKETEDRDQRLKQLLDSKPHEFRDQQRNYKRDLQPYKKDIIEALDSIKVIDPACGSGAFPMGMMQLLLSCYERLEPRFDSYVTKLDIIKNNLYGVDIEPMAVEISRLRAWLSIIVDEEADSEKIEPLPNLDFKFICANSLIPLKKDSVGLFDTLQEKDLIEIRDKYFNARSNKSKQLLHQKYEKLIGYKRTGNMFSSSYEKQLKSYHPFNSENITQFFDAGVMFGADTGFDIVIANPPYVRVQTIDEQIKDIYKMCYKTAKGKYDLYILFTELGLNILKPDGVLSYIVPNKFTNTHYGAALRDMIIHISRIIDFVDFSDKGAFLNVTNYPCILVLNKTDNLKGSNFNYKMVKEVSDSLMASLYHAKSQKNYEDKNISSFEIKQNDLGPDFWVFGDRKLKDVIDKIQQKDKFDMLKERAENIFEGLVTGNNKVYFVSKSIITDNEIEKNIIKKLPKGKNIQKYYYSWDDYYVIYPYELKNNTMTLVNLDNYPNARKYFLKYKKELQKRHYLMNSGREWYEIWNPRKIQWFEQTKIITPNLSKTNKFALDLNQGINDYICLDHDCYGIILKDKKIENYLFLLAMLNSTLTRFFIENISPMFSGGYYKYHTQYLEKIPIPKEINNEALSHIISIVRKVMNITREGDWDATISKRSQVEEYLKQIDDRMYALYRLDHDDVKVIENYIGKR